MKNFVFISPNFPVNYWQFCRQLRNNGLRVLGIGDQPYDTLLPELKSALHEYYKVGSMENYDEVYRAVAFFISKYGRIDWLESQRLPSQRYAAHQVQIQDEGILSEGRHRDGTLPYGG